MPFFNSTKNLKKQVDDFFLFLWPSQVALWHLRKEISSLSEDVERLTNHDLLRRFAKQSQIRGADLIKACVDVGWDKQIDIYAKLMLVNIIALYEGFVASILDEMRSYDADTNELRIEHKYGRKAQDNFKNEKIAKQIEVTRGQTSDVLQGSIYPTINTRDKFDQSILLNRMLCFRCFKEMRNCLVHGNCIATEHCEAAYNSYCRVANPTSLRLAKEPICNPVAAGVDVVLSIYGVVGFSDLIMKLALSIDAELSYSIIGENLIATRLRSKRVQHRVFSTEKTRRARQITKMIHTAELPTPVRPNDLEKFLLDHRFFGR